MVYGETLSGDSATRCSIWKAGHQNCDNYQNKADGEGRMGIDRWDTETLIYLVDCLAIATGDFVGMTRNFSLGGAAL